MTAARWTSGPTSTASAARSTSCLRGRSPFGDAEHRGTLDKMNAHVRETPPPIRQFAPGVHDQLAAILDRMLAKDPADRFATPAEVAEALAPFCAAADLHGLLADSPPHPVTLSPHHPSPAAVDRVPPRRRLKVALGLAGVLFFGIAVGLAAGIVIRIQHGDKETTLTAPEGSNITVGPDGQTTIKLPGAIAPAATPAAAAPLAKAIQGTWQVVSTSQHFYPLDYAGWDGTGTREDVVKGSR